MLRHSSSEACTASCVCTTSKLEGPLACWLTGTVAMMALYASRRGQMRLDVMYKKENGTIWLNRGSSRKVEAALTWAGGLSCTPGGLRLDLLGAGRGLRCTPVMHLLLLLLLLLVQLLLKLYTGQGWRVLLRHSPSSSRHRCGCCLLRGRGPRSCLLGGCRPVLGGSQRTLLLRLLGW